MSDADSVSFNKTQVLVKQDGVNLYIGFNMSYPPTDLKYDAVYIFLDLDDNGGSAPQPDDIGLVVYNNGTLAEGNLTESKLGEANGWSAATQSYPSAWQVEFNITYSKINVVAGQEKNIGAFFMSTSFATTHYYWPPTLSYGNYGVPSMWGAITSTGYNWTHSRAPGVSPGQFVHYECYFVWDEGNDTDLESWVSNQPLLGMNMTVLSVEEASVTYEIVEYNSTGIVYEFTHDVDIETGGYSYEYFLIAANLTAGDVVYTRDNNTRINETAVASYLGQQLETNHLSIFTNHSDISFIGLAYHFSASVSEDYFWHRQSGILLEMIFEFNTSRVVGMDLLVGHLILGAVATISIPPVIPEFQSAFVILLFMIVTLFAVIVYKRKKPFET